MDFYAILGVEKKCSKEDLKKAYRRMALRFHPDHNPSETATQEFQYLALIHETLQNDAKRVSYDKHGKVDEDSHSVSADAESYWRSVFPKITPHDIELFKKEYIGSAMELEDIRNAYQKYKGDMRLVVEAVPFADHRATARIIEIVQTERLNRKFAANFRRSCSGLTEALAEVEEGEKEEAEAAGKALGLGVEAAATSDSFGALVAAFQSRGKQRHEALIEGLMSKYADDKENKSSARPRRNSSRSQSSVAVDEEESEPAPKLVEPTEEEFAEAQARIMARASGKGRKTKLNTEPDDSTTSLYDTGSVSKGKKKKRKR